VASLPTGRVLRYLAPFRDGDLVALWAQSSQTPEMILGVIPRGAQPHEIETGLSDDQTGIAVSPRQDGYYYGRHSGAANELLRRSRRGGAPSLVPGGISPSSGFAISPDGKRLVYSTCRETMLVARTHPGA